MRHLTLTIEGEFWDYLIKYNELILWTYDGRTEVYDWKSFIEDIARKKNNPELYMLFQNKNVKDYNNKFNRNNYDNEYAPNIDLEVNISKNELDYYLLQSFEIPFNNLAISLDSYNNDIFVNTDDGLYTVNRTNLRNKQKVWDNPLYNIKVGKHGRIAMSAGDEGVYEYSLSKNLVSNIPKKMEIDKNIYLLSNRHSNTVSWINNDVFSTSSIKDAFIVNSNNKYKEKIYYEKIIEESEIFKSYRKQIHEISWASNNKLYRVYDNNKLEIVSYESEKNQKIIFKSKFVEFMSWKGNIIEGSSAKFGTVIECENALIILFDDGNFINIPGEIIRWKIYDRYHRYNNILGIVFENKIVFKAFNC